LSPEPHQVSEKKEKEKEKKRPADVKPGKSLVVGFYWNLINTWLCLNRIIRNSIP
jgi:hypothetical protein